MKQIDEKPKNGVEYSFRLIAKKGIPTNAIKPIPILIDEPAAFTIRPDGIVIQGQLYPRDILQGVQIQVIFTENKEVIQLQTGKLACATPTK